MIKPPMAQTIRQLKLAGKSNRQISQLLKISRNTIRKLLQKNDENTSIEGSISHPVNEELIQCITGLMTSCCGNLVRVHEIITQEHHYDLAYSTLTYLVRKYDLRQSQRRVGRYHFEPGLEMQHDTSPHEVILAGKRVKAQCASLVLAFSRRLFIQYYPCFTRFEAKHFLSEALAFMQGSPQRCIIDNTHVVLAAGAGEHAVIAPEMLFFSRLFGFEFRAHAVNHPNRKGRVERPFYYVETNFLAGRIFTDWQDLNQQALNWCQNVANQKYKQALGMTPETAYIQEKPSLIPLPKVMPPIYQHCQRVANNQGYICLDANSYSIPESHIGHTMEVYKYLHSVEIYYQHHLIVTHPRILGKRDQRSTIKGHHPTLYLRQHRQANCEAEKQLMGCNSILDNYMKALKSSVRGRGGWEFKQLLYLKRLYPEQAFIAAIQQAYRYRLYDLKRLENLILKYIAGEFFNL
jgi:transposase